MSHFCKYLLALIATTTLVLPCKGVRTERFNALVESCVIATNGKINTGTKYLMASNTDAVEIILPKENRHYVFEKIARAFDNLKSNNYIWRQPWMLVQNGLFISTQQVEDDSSKCLLMIYYEPANVLNLSEANYRDTDYYNKMQSTDCPTLSNPLFYQTLNMATSATSGYILSQEIKDLNNRESNLIVNIQLPPLTTFETIMEKLAGVHLRLAMFDKYTNVIPWTKTKEDIWRSDYASTENKYNYGYRTPLIGFRYNPNNRILTVIFDMVNE